MLCAVALCAAAARLLMIKEDERRLFAHFRGQALHRLQQGGNAGCVVIDVMLVRRAEHHQQHQRQIGEKERQNQQIAALRRQPDHRANQ